MKYDIARNEEGPLRKTVYPKMKTENLGRGTDLDASKRTDINTAPGVPTAERHPALDERLNNVEAHFAVKYGASASNALETELIKRTSACSAAVLARPADPSRRSHHTSGERLSPLGRSSL